MADDAHPTDLELSRLLDERLDVEAAMRVREHLDRCLPCRVQVGQAQPVDADEPSARELTALVADAKGPPPDAVAALGSPRDVAPAAGQLWRLEWRGRTVLGLLLAVVDQGSEARIAPVTTDPDWGDQHTIAVPADWSPLDVDLAVWVALRAHAPSEVLDRPLGAVAPTAVQAAAMVEAAHAADEPSDVAALDARLTVGSPITEPADERREYRAHVADELSRVVDGARADLADADDEQDFDSLLRAHGIDAREVGDALGVDARFVFGLRRGTERLDDAQSRLLEERFGLPSDVLRDSGAAVDPSLWKAMARPAVRGAFEEAARQRGRAVADLKEECAEWSVALAARHTGKERDPVTRWERIILEWLDAPR